MFAFFRTYQRYFFLVISIVIVVSFSFFGTYNALPSENLRSQTAFYAADGSAITRGELDQMVQFLSSDSEDKLHFGGAWGPNFLNDGVIKKNFLQTGLAQVLAEQFSKDLSVDFQNRSQNEKLYNLYTHPEASFVSTESVWSYAAPTLKMNFDNLQKSNNPLSPEAFNARVKLYLGEMRFPAPYLKQYLRYQEKQYSWLAHDQSIDQMDLSLFGYHSLEDWFGPRFINLIAEYIINSAKTAQKQGYSVPIDEALADLNRNAAASFQQNIRSQNLGVSNSLEYLNEQLRIMGLDQRMAAKIWQNVLLFRRLFQDGGNAMFVDPNTFSGFIQYAKESVSGDLFQLPKELQLADYRALQKFELYNSAVAQADSYLSLDLPATFLSEDEVKKSYPELVHKRYLLDITEVDKNSLLSKVPLKEIWNWQVNDQNWASLKKDHPELATKKADSHEERFKILDSLEPKIKAKLDVKAQTAILETHPEWISQALENKKGKTVEVSLSPKKGSSTFNGMQDATPLITLLDAAEISESPNEDSNIKALGQFTADQRHYYKIKVLAKQPKEEILTFAEANRSGVLDNLLDKKLNAYYEKIKEAHPAKFQNADKTWKSFQNVKDAVADLYLSKTLAAIKAESKKKDLSGDQAANLRLMLYAKNVKNKIQKDPSLIPELTLIEIGNIPNTQLAESKPLKDQWKLEKTSFEVDRSTPDDRFSLIDLVAANEWSEVKTSPNGGIYFTRKIDHKNSETDVAISEKVKYARSQLSNDLQTVLGTRLAAEWKAKDAISLEFLERNLLIEEE